MKSFGQQDVVCVWSARNRFDLIGLLSFRHDAAVGLLGYDNMSSMTFFREGLFAKQCQDPCNCSEAFDHIAWSWFSA